MAMKETKPRKKYFKSPERHTSPVITKIITKTVPRVIYVMDEEEFIAATLRKQNMGNKK